MKIEHEKLYWKYMKQKAEVVNKERIEKKKFLEENKEQLDKIDSQKLKNIMDMRHKVVKEEFK